MRYFNYLKYVLKHKYYVLIAGRLLGVSLPRLIFHDWDKFLPFMWWAYANAFYKPDGSKKYDPNPNFALAWNRHQKRNRHHWQYWLITWDIGKTEPLPMPIVDIVEMVADWWGAGWAITGNKWGVLSWYENNRDKIIVHPDTLAAIDEQIGKIWEIKGKG